MPSQVRMQRIADRIREEISELLINKISDPRVQYIYITDVNVDREMAYANIYVSAIEGSVRAKEVLAGLERQRIYSPDFVSACGFAVIPSVAVFLGPDT